MNGLIGIGIGMYCLDIGLRCYSAYGRSDVRHVDPQHVQAQDSQSQELRD